MEAAEKMLSVILHFRNMEAVKVAEQAVGRSRYSIVALDALGNNTLLATWRL